MRKKIVIRKKNLDFVYWIEKVWNMALLERVMQIEELHRQVYKKLETSTYSVEEFELDKKQMTVWINELKEQANALDIYESIHSETNPYGVIESVLPLGLHSMLIESEADLAKKVCCLIYNVFIKETRIAGRISSCIKESGYNQEKCASCCGYFENFRSRTGIKGYDS